MEKTESEPHDIAYLREAMTVFHDIRKASIIIADSIRVRERCALRGTGLLRNVNVGECTGLDMSDPVRCPICISEFHDPTVVSRICGHGMHKSCALQQLGAGSGDRDVVLCSICRTPYGRADLVHIKGVLPPVGNAIAWRSVFLTEPWRQKLSTPDSTSGKESLDGCLERLLVSIRALFTTQSDLSRPIGAVLSSFDTVRKLARNDANRLKEEKAALQEREQRVRETELGTTYRDEYNETLAASCANRVRSQETSLLRSRDEIILQQRQLQRMIEEFQFKEEKLHERLIELENNRNEGKEKTEHTNELCKKRQRRSYVEDYTPIQSDKNLQEDVHVISSSPDSTGEASTGIKKNMKRNRRL